MPSASSCARRHPGKPPHRAIRYDLFAVSPQSRDNTPPSIYTLMRITMRKTSLLAALLLGATSFVATAQIPPADGRAPAPLLPARPAAPAAPLEDLSKQPAPIPGLTDKLGL